MLENYHKPIPIPSTLAKLFAAVAVLSCPTGTLADPGKLRVGVDRPGVQISPMLYGLMTEEINHSYDGGIYAELIQNRAFKDNPTRPVHWSVIQDGGGRGGVQLDASDPVNTALSTSLRFTITSASETARVGVANDGYWGVPVRPATKYRASFYARTDGSFKGRLSVAIESADGATTWAAANIKSISSQWRQYTCTLTTAVERRATSSISVANRFAIYGYGTGTIWLSQASLFPPTFNNRPNGDRIDLMQKLGAMKPAFLRLPGGNYLEGDTFAERFAWKDTIGRIWQRPGHRSPWGYRSSDGLGLLEYLEWCEDLKMEPILAVFAGYVLRGQHVGPGEALQPYVDEALDEIEYVTGDPSTKWGAARAADGHRAPFKLTYVEIGNEDWFDRSGSYDGRFTQFFDAIRAKCSAIKLIATTRVRSRAPDLVDDHYYRSAADMERDVHHYDHYSRTGPKIFVGEWASTEGSPTPTIQAALGDAAWLTGLERNSDLIPISCYAPLLVNVNPGASQWGTNLIGYNALDSFGSPSYYVQAMFANNRGDRVLPVEITPQPVTAPVAAAEPHGAIGVGTWLTHSEFKDMKVVNGTGTLYQLNPNTGLDGWSRLHGTWRSDHGVITQSQDEVNCRLTAGDIQWDNYTYTLKARKISGAEGFLVMFHALDENNFIWWNVGGWGNTRSAIEQLRNGANRQLGQPADVTVETERWYDVRIEVAGRRIRCYLDGKLITEANDVPGEDGIDPIYATASRDLATGDVILKVVNVSASPQDLRVDLQGARGIGAGTVEVISGNPADVNSLSEPKKVAPKKTSIKIETAAFLHTFPAHSVTVLRLKVKEK